MLLLVTEPPPELLKANPDLGPWKGREVSSRTGAQRNIGLDNGNFPAGHGGNRAVPFALRW